MATKSKFTLDQQISRTLLRIRRYALNNGFQLTPNRADGQLQGKPDSGWEDFKLETGFVHGEGRIRLEWQRQAGGLKVGWTRVGLVMRNWSPTEIDLWFAAARTEWMEETQ